VSALLREQIALRCGGGLRYHSDGVDLLTDVEIDLEQGRLHAVIGENGAGKTTLLDVLSGDLKLTSGWVKYGDRSLEKFPVAELARRRAYLRQHHNLEFGFKVIDVIRLGRLPFSPDDQLINEVMAALTLEDLRERDYTSLSGGEKQRVQIARVLAQVWRPEQMICFLDEPLAALDLRYQHQLLAVLRKLAAKGLTVVMVMHDPQFASKYTDRQILLKSGQVLAQGVADVVFSEANMTEAFGVGVTKIFPTEN